MPISPPKSGAPTAKIILVPSARVQHQAQRRLLALEKADFLNARAVFLGKYQGLGAGLQARIGTVLGPLAGFRFGELKHTINGQKIDGTQE